MYFKKISTYKNLLKFYSSDHIFRSIRIFYTVKIHPEYSKIVHLGILNILKKIFLRQIYYAKNIFQNTLYAQDYELKKKKILVISHLLNENHIEKNDFYFGNLEKYLRSNNIKYQFLLINHSEKNSSYLNKKNKKKNILILNKHLSLLKELKIFFLQLKELINIFFNKKKFKNVNLKEITFSLFSYETKHAIRIFYLLENLLTKIKPDTVITTFEGFPWERMVFKSAKNFSNDTKTIGYQNIFLTKNYKSIFYKLNNGYDPDCIWLSGIIPKKLFESSELKNKQLKIVGKLNNIRTRKKIKNVDNNTCLVIPEGIYSECLKLFNFSYQCSLLFKQLKFIWRVHPVINFKKVLKSLNLTNASLPKNIKISKNKNITDDFNHSKFVLYRGSYAVINAIKHKLIPIYLNINDKENIDVLKLYKKRKNYVNTQHQLFRIMYKKFKFNKKEFNNMNKFILQNENLVKEKKIMDLLR